MGVECPSFGADVGESKTKKWIKMDRDESKFPLITNKYHHGNMIYPNVPGIRLVLIKCDLAENSYGLFISIFYFFLQNLRPIVQSSCSCLSKLELMSHVTFRKLKVLLEIGMYQYFLSSQTIEVQLQGLEHARIQVIP